MTTLANPLDFEKQYHSPDMVKVIVDQFDNALYFSRSPIPYQREIVTIFLSIIIRACTLLPVNFY